MNLGHFVAMEVAWAIFIGALMGWWVGDFPYGILVTALAITGWYLYGRRRARRQHPCESWGGPPEGPRLVR